jgi:thiamine biosynthesis protein ThiS
MIGCMTITLNFERCSWPEASLTVAAIMERRRWTFPQIIVKINGTVVPKETWQEAVVTDGDEVEMFHLVAGG